MSTDQRRLAYLQAIRGLMDERVAESGPEASINPLLVVRKDDVTDVYLECADARLLCNLAKIVVAGFEADELVLATDSYRAESPTNPEGQPWTHGEMTRRRAEPAVKALLSEQINVMQARRGLDFVHLELLRYRREDGKLAWFQDERFEAAKTTMAKVEGVLPELLVEAVNEQPIIEAGAALTGMSRKELTALFGLGEDKTQLHTRIVTIKYLLQRGLLEGQRISVLWGAANQGDAETIERAFRVSGLNVSIDLEKEAE